MQKAIFASSVAALTLSVLSASAQAAVISYHCDGNSPFSLRIDTKTHFALLTAPNRDSLVNAQVNDTTIDITAASPRIWTMRIDRKTGRAIDSDGDISVCGLAK